MKISVVIPNFNGSKLLEKNLPKILSSVGEVEVIIVDDASTDGSVIMLRKQFPQVKVVVKDKNEGFASAVNEGVQNASADLIFLLNSDVLPKPDFLKYLIPHFADPQVFAVGCLQRSNQGIQEGRGIGKFSKGFLTHSKGSLEKNNTLWVFGGAGMFRKSIWEKLGGLNTLYDPFYWEDIDLSYRALKACYKLVIEPKSIVMHDQNSGAIRSTYSPAYINTIACRNQIIFVWLNITDLPLILNHLFYLPIHILRALIRFNGAFLTGFILALLKLPYILISRNRNKKTARISDKEIMLKYLS